MSVRRLRSKPLLPATEGSSPNGGDDYFNTLIHQVEIVQFSLSTAYNWVMYLLESSLLSIDHLGVRLLGGGGYLVYHRRHP